MRLRPRMPRFRLIIWRARATLTRLRFPRKEIDEVVTCVRLHMQFKDVTQMRKATLRRLLLRPTFPLELELHRLDCLGSHGRLDHYEFLKEQAAALARQPASIMTSAVSAFLTRCRVSSSPLSNPM